MRVHTTRRNEGKGKRKVSARSSKKKDGLLDVQKKKRKKVRVPSKVHCLYIIYQGLFRNKRGWAINFHSMFVNVLKAFREMGN
jgi:hypothetical protein